MLIVVRINDLEIVHITFFTEGYALVLSSKKPLKHARVE